MILNVYLTIVFVAGTVLAGSAVHYAPAFANDTEVLQSGHALPSTDNTVISQGTDCKGVAFSSSYSTDNTEISQGTNTIGSTLVNRDGYTGKGIKVAVIDAGFDIKNSEISGNIAEYKSFWNPSNIKGEEEDDTNHGTAVAEIIVDIAPDVELYLYNFDTSVEFFKLVECLIERKDIDIATMSLGWPSIRADGKSHISKAVDMARDNGILWITSAGNEATSHWQGQFWDPDGDGYHNFSYFDETIDIDVEPEDELWVSLSWDDDFENLPNDFDLYMYDLSMYNYNSNELDESISDQFTKPPFELDASENDQLDMPPFERVEHTFSSYTTAKIAIKNYDSNRVANFQLFSSNPLNEHAVARSSITVPADARGSLSVGASHWLHDSLTSYSSQGPTLDGIIKPDITGPTAVSTTAYGPDEFFGGTSASAPHVAGAAALVMEKYPKATADEVQDILQSIVYNRHEKSNRDGTGRVDVSMLAGSDILALHSDPTCVPKKSCFFPRILDTDSGDAVTWVNTNNSDIIIMGSSGSGDSFKSSTISRGERFTKTFHSGAFNYADATNPGSTGQIIVGNVPPATKPLPPLNSAKITGPNEITLKFSEAVTATIQDFAELKLQPGGDRAVTSVSGSGTSTIVLNFGGPVAPPDSTATIHLAGASSVPTTITIEPIHGSGVPGCENQGGCYIPSIATVDVGGVVIFSNTDNVAHTYTSGSVEEGPSGIFDSGLAIAGSSYEYTADTIDQIPYFCILHPWMAGTIVVQQVSPEIPITDGQTPTLTDVSISSQGAHTAVATVGDTITLRFTASEQIQTPTVVINGKTTVPTNSGNTWMATTIIDQTDYDSGADSVTFSITFEDVSENAGLQVVATTDGTSVSYDKTEPGTGSDNTPVTLNITAFHDGGDGIRQEVERPFASLSILIYIPSQDMVDLLFTDANGMVSKTDLTSDPFYVIILPPEGHAASNYPLTLAGTTYNGVLYVENPTSGSSYNMDVGIKPDPCALIPAGNIAAILLGCPMT